MEMTPQDSFTIGGQSILSTHSEQAVPAPEANAPFLDIQIRIGTLLKAENVAVLLGAGASVDCGGPLLGSLPLVLERQLLDEGLYGTHRVRRWLQVFYLALRCSSTAHGLPRNRLDIISRYEMLIRQNVSPLPVNVEKILVTLHRWHSVLSTSTDRLRVDGTHHINVKASEVDAALRHATHALARVCDLPTTIHRDGLAVYEIFVRKLLARPLNLRRTTIFTLNYDTLIEKAADAVGVALLDGFVGTHHRVFRPESYEQDLYFPAETTEGNVHRSDRVLRLCKLHGSITWTSSEPSVANPYGVRSMAFDPAKRSKSLLIYPTPAKSGDTLQLPYSELFRRFANSVGRPQSVLFVIGYSFGDAHVNTIIQQALAIPSFTLVIVDKCPKNRFVTTLRNQQDRRIWILQGPNLGTFLGFVRHILPDLRDAEINKRVVATRRALLDPPQPSVGNGRSQDR